MSDAAVISIINGVFSLLSVVITLLIRSKMNVVEKSVAIGNSELSTVHKQINSKMDELVDLNRKASHAEGKLEAIKEIKEEDKKSDNK